MVKEVTMKCLVCGSPIHSARFKYLGQGQFRHDACGPGSEAWLRFNPDSKIAAALYDYREQAAKMSEATKSRLQEAKVRRAALGILPRRRSARKAK